MNCPRCGKPLPEDAKFCLECGERITAPPKSETAEPKEEPAALCPKCGTALEEDATFCAECGAPVSGEPSATADEPPAPEKNIDPLMFEKPPEAVEAPGAKHMRTLILSGAAIVIIAVIALFVFGIDGLKSTFTITTYGGSAVEAQLGPRGIAFMRANLEGDDLVVLEYLLDGFNLSDHKLRNGRYEATDVIKELLALYNKAVSNNNARATAIRDATISSDYVTVPAPTPTSAPTPTPEPTPSARWTLDELKRGGYPGLTYYPEYDYFYGSYDAELEEFLAIHGYSYYEDWDEGEFFGSGYESGLTNELFAQHNRDRFIEDYPWIFTEVIDTWRELEPILYYFYFSYGALPLEQRQEIGYSSTSSYWEMEQTAMGSSIVFHHVINAGGASNLYTATIYALPEDVYWTVHVYYIESYSWFELDRWLREDTSAWEYLRQFTGEPYG